MDEKERAVELAAHYHVEIIDGLNRAKSAMLKLARIRLSGGADEIPKTKMRAFARLIESAGQLAKDYRL